MWLMTTQGFYSVVAHRTQADLFIVRARVRKDLAALERQLPGVEAEIYEDRSADYRWRVLVTREDWALAVSRLALEVDYANFKSAVRDRQGARRANAYHRVWDVLTGLEPKFWKRYGASWKTTMLDDDLFERESGNV